MQKISDMTAPIFPAAREVVFIDSRVQDLHTILAALRPGVQAVVLNDHEDGAAQMARALQGEQSLASISVVSHGDAGVLLLGKEPLFAGNLAQHQADLQALGAALAPGGDLLLYGCNVGAGEQGAAFVAALAQATGADVAASSNSTGGAGRGGDWALEVASGSIEAAPVLQASALAGYDFVLHTATASTLAELKAAIASAQGDGAHDLIALTGDIVFASALDTVKIHVTDGHTLRLVGGGYTLSGNDLARVLEVNTTGVGSAVEISGLTIAKGLVAGAGGGASVGYYSNAGHGGDALGAGIWNQGALTLVGSAVTGNRAAGGGGGGVGGDEGGTPGRAGNTSTDPNLNYNNFFGSGQPSKHQSGGLASDGVFTIGGGGGGSSGYRGQPFDGDQKAGRGGHAVGGIYNSGALTLLGTDFSGNLGAGGGGGSGITLWPEFVSGNGGTGVGALWNAGGSVRMDASTQGALTTGNSGAGGKVELYFWYHPLALVGQSIAGLHSPAGTVDTNYTPPPATANTTLMLITSTDAVTFTEGNNALSTPVVIDSALTLSDADSPTLASATVAITGNFQSGKDVLALVSNSATMGDITASYNASTGVLTLTSAGAAATAAQYQAALRSVTYTNSSDLPVKGVRTIGFSANDGSLSSAVANKSLKVIPVNDAPINHLPAAQTVAQGGALAFSSANGNAITVTDADPSPFSYEVLLEAGNGTIRLSNTSGLTAVGGNDGNSDRIAFSGNLSAINAALGSLVFTPQAGFYGTASLRIFVNDPGGLPDIGGPTFDDDILAITVTQPAAQVTSVIATTGDGTYKVGGTATIAVTFNQAVTLDTTHGTPTLLLETGAIDRSAQYLSGSGDKTLFFLYTVQAGDSAADLDYVSTTALALNGATLQNDDGVDSLLTLPEPGSAQSLAGQSALVIDGVLPTATIAVADTALSVGETTQVTITFSEAVTGFILNDLSAANGVLSNLTSSDGGKTWTATLTPVADTKAAANSITLDNTGITDLAGNAGAGTTASGNYAINTVRPSASIVVSDTALAVDGTSLVTITFSEAVTGLDNADLTIANATLSALTSSDGGITWTATLTANAGVTHPASVITLDNTGVVNSAGNAGSGTTDSNHYAIDTERPTATIVVADTVLGMGQSTAVTITFSEAVTGLALADLSAANGVLSDLLSSDGGITWTAMLTPTAGTTALANAIAFDTANVQDAAGNAGRSIALSNSYAIDTFAPVLLAASVSGNSLVVTYADTSALDAVNVPGAGAFAVTAGGAANAVTAVAVDAVAKTVTLTLTNAVSFGQTVTVSYTDPTPGDDANAIQDTAGNDAASLVGVAVTNNAAPPPPPPPPGDQVDGVTVTTTVTTNAQGHTVTTLTVAPVPANHTDSSANSALADIPLARGADGAPLITIGLPVGVGMSSDTVSAPGLSLRELLVSVSQSRMGNGADFAQTVQNGIDQYLPTVLDPSQVVLRSLTFTAAPGAQAGTLAQPIAISGAVGAGEGSLRHPGRAEALVIDTRGLPPGAVLQLDNVEFAIVLGACTVIGGAGANFVIGDASAQTIILGEGDDVLHGGGGDDFIGSKGGDDQLYGGADNDTLSGGAGNDTLYGGTGLDTAVFSGERSQYSVTQEFGVFTVHALSGDEGADTLVNVERIEFADQSMDIGSQTASLSWLATLYQQVLGRQADLGGFQWWAQEASSGAGQAHVLMSFLLSPERVANTGQDFNALDTADKVEYFYNTLLARPAEAAGKAWWVEQIDNNGQNIVHVAEQFLHSAELTGQYLAPQEWDFLV